MIGLITIIHKVINLNTRRPFLNHNLYVSYILIQIFVITGLAAEAELRPPDTVSESNPAPLTSSHPQN
jgi:hypothetical protein